MRTAKNVSFVSSTSVDKHVAMRDVCDRHLKESGESENGLMAAFPSSPVCHKDTFQRRGRDTTQRGSHFFTYLWPVANAVQENLAGCVASQHE